MPRKSNKGKDKGGFFKRRFDPEKEEFASEFEFEEETAEEQESSSFASAFSDFAPELTIPDEEEIAIPDVEETVKGSAVEELADEIDFEDVPEGAEVEELPEDDGIEILPELMTEEFVVPDEAENDAISDEIPEEEAEQFQVVRNLVKYVEDEIN